MPEPTDEITPPEGVASDGSGGAGPGASAFADLVSKADEPIEKKDEEPDYKTEYAKLKAEREADKVRWTEKRRDLELAVADERRKRKEVEKRAKAPKEDEDEDELEPEDVKPTTAMDLDKTIEDKFRAKEEEKYQKSVVAEIRERVRFREEAEVIQHYVNKLPERTGDAAEDVRRAIKWLDVIQEEKRGTSLSPMGSGYSGGGTPPKAISKQAVELAKVFGHKAEDLKNVPDEIEY